MTDTSNDLRSVPVGANVVLCGDGVRIFASVVQQGSDWLRAEYATGGIVVRALVMHDGQVRSFTVCGSVNMRADAAVLPPHETWEFVFADGSRESVDAEPEYDDEFGEIRWTARPRSRPGFSGVEISAARAVYAAGMSFNGTVRTIVPPTSEQTASAAIAPETP